VDQVQVDVIQAEFAQTAIDGGQRRIRSLVVVPQLGGDEQLVARDTGFGDGRTDTFLVAVGSRGVDVPVARLQCRRHHPLGLGRVHLEHSEAELRDDVPVIQFDTRRRIAGTRRRVGQRRVTGRVFGHGPSFSDAAGVGSPPGPCALRRCLHGSGFAKLLRHRTADARDDTARGNDVAQEMR